MNIQRKLENKRVLVTGAGTGIGRGIALEFAKEGAILALHYWPRTDEAEAVVSEIMHIGGKVQLFKTDFQHLDAIKQLALEASDFLGGGIDILINNAGITVNIPFEQVTPEIFDAVYNVNIRAQFFLTQYTLPFLAKRRPASVINISSVHAFAGLIEHTVYAGTKGAIVAFTRALALELIGSGIRVNAIAPGWIFTENQREVLGDTFDVQLEGKNIPAGFIGAPIDIGRLAIFLASEESRYIIGQTIICDGGQCAIMPLTGDFRIPRTEQWGTQYIADLKPKRPPGS